MQWTTSLSGIRSGTRVSMVCWESQELKNKISGSPKCLQNQHIPISEGGAALLLCLPWPFPAFQSEGLFCVSGWFLPVLPSQRKRLPHTHVLTITYNTELSPFYLIIHGLSHSLLSPRWQYLEFRELRGPTVSAYTLIKNIIIYPSYNNTCQHPSIFPSLRYGGKGETVIDKIGTWSNRS